MHDIILPSSFLCLVSFISNRIRIFRDLNSPENKQIGDNSGTFSKHLFCYIVTSVKKMRVLNSWLIFKILILSAVLNKHTL